MHAFRALGAAVLILGFAAGCARITGPVGQVEPDELGFTPASFDDLNGWPGADPRGALSAFAASCKAIAGRGDGDQFGPVAAYGTVAEWRAPCAAAALAKPASAQEARQFFEAWFAPAAASNRGETVGLFTGYYEPELNGSRKPTERFRTPLYARPVDLVSVDLGVFRPGLKGERIAGRIDGAKLVPYPTRADIVNSGLKGRASIVAYVDDEAAAFFLHVQGSGRVRLGDGEVIRVAYDGQNGHTYTAIGRVLIDRGEIKREQMSMQAIRVWLDAHPAQAGALMNQNPSYVFFKELPIADPKLGAEGAQGVSLTPEASLAVDLKFHGLGAPMWVDATAPATDATASDVAFQRLVIAQDTGGAIRGPVRGDVYWGSGAQAEAVAGRMAHKGKLTVLLPKAAAQRLR